MGRKPEMLHTGAEAGLAGKRRQEWLAKEKTVAHNITLKSAPVAERMIGYIKNQIINAMRGTDKKWWEAVYGVVKEYNEKHVSRNTLMTPNDAAKGGEPCEGEDATGEHQEDRRPATPDRQGGQGQDH